MSLQEEFNQHAEKVNKLTQATNEDLLILYGLFKQANFGDVNTARPGIFDPKGRAKWDSWKSYEGKSKDDAMTEYITKAKQMLEANGIA
ncbi:acyl-CoA-binding domain-containing protein 6 [Silene latifolia]|uniref:acyl-CoA-binding domain-containing protein 6 n=1 Tax=Silene latifolia TaxID=37657 RepID=UPI003D78256E